MACDSAAKSSPSSPWWAKGDDTERVKKGEGEEEAEGDAALLTDDEIPASSFSALSKARRRPQAGGAVLTDCRRCETTRRRRVRLCESAAVKTV